MSILDFDSGTWTDPWFQDLPENGKLLFIYLWTNNHKNLICIYPISLKTIENETGLEPAMITNLISLMRPKVDYDMEHKIVMVINHVRRQFLRTGKLSLKVKIAFEKNLLSLPPGHRFIETFLNKYKELDIPYPYPIHTL